MDCTKNKAGLDHHVTVIECRPTFEEWVQWAEKQEHTQLNKEALWIRSFGK